MSIAGIDFSSRCIDVVLLDEDSDAATWHRFELSGQDAFDRARDVRRATTGWRAIGLWDDVLACGIEDPRGYNAGSLYRVQGAILAKLPATLLVYPWIPSAWRKTVGLPGNASKNDVFMHVVRLIRFDGEDDAPQDAFDAACIALATRTVIEKVAA